MQGGTILLAVTREAELREAAMLTQAAIEVGLTPVVLVSRRTLAAAFDPGVRRLLCVGGGVAPIVGAASVTSAPLPRGQAGALKSQLLRLPGVALLRGIRGWFRLYVQRCAMRKALFDVDPKAVFVFDERTPDINMPLLREAKDRGLRTIVVPYAMAAGEAREFVRLREPACHVKGARLAIALRLFPNHVRKSTSDVSLLFYPFWETVAVYLHGFGRCSPWILGGGLADLLAVFGEYDREAAIQEGVHPTKIRVTGQPSLDELHRSLLAREVIRVEIESTYRLASSKPFIICAVPHQAEENLLDEGVHLAETRALFAVLSRQKLRLGAHVLLSLHPKSKEESYRDLADEAGLVLVRAPLSRILPLADVMVGTLSSTVRWAAALAIPVMVVDTLRRGYKIFDHLGVVRITYSADELESTFVESFDEEFRWRGALGVVKDQANKVALIDGKACARLLALTCDEGELDGK